MKKNGATALYLLFLTAGIVVGVLFGARILERFGIVPKPVATAQHEASGAQETPKPAITGASARVPDDGVSAVRNTAIVTATKRVAPCVVGIVVTQIQVVRNQYPSNDFFDFFFGPEMQPRYRQVESIGSGFVIREDGLVLTNFHVIENAAKLYVNFSDGRRFEGKIVGSDERADIAVIKVDGKGLPCVKLGDAEKAMIGEWAIAIGNPFLNFINDAHPTVTVGVVSALDRNFAPSEGVYYQNMIQTDAAINPGNSGGPLVNALGEVIGINTFIYTGSNNNRGSIGIGFAIPINRARRVTDEILKYKERRQVWTGIAVQDLTRSVALALGYDGLEGVAIVSVQKGSPGEKAGLRTGDIIKRMGNRTIVSHLDIDGFFLDYFVGDTVSMTILRKGKRMEVSLTLGEYKGQ